MKLLSVLLSVVGVSGLVWVSPVSAEMGGLASHRGGSRGERGDMPLQFGTTADSFLKDTARIWRRII